MSSMSVEEAIAIVNAAVRRYMTARRRELRAPERREYPKFQPGMTTAAYILAFHQNGAHILPYDLRQYRRPAPLSVD